MTVFYVYLLLREDGTPFYVGKGKGRRWMIHQWDALKGEDSHKARIIRKTIKTVGHLPKKKVATGLTEAEAFALETSLIAEFRAVGHKLVNLTNGGDGTAGWKPPAKFRERSRRTLKAIWDDPKKREERTQAIADAWADPETGSRMREATKIGHATAEFSEKMTIISQEAWTDPDMRERQRAGVTDAWTKPDIREKMVTGLKNAWTDPEKHAKRCASMREGWARRRARLAAASSENPS